MWLTCLPIEEFGFSLHRRAFLGNEVWLVSVEHSPLMCVVTLFLLVMPSHAQGVVFHLLGIMINEIRDLIARLLTEVCRDVRIELDLLQPIPFISPLVGASANSYEGA